MSITSNQVIITAPCAVYYIINITQTVFLPINNKACISNTDSHAHERCFTQVRIFLTFFLVGSVGFIKKNCFLIRQPAKKKKVHIGLPTTEPTKGLIERGVGVSGKRDLD